MTKITKISYSKKEIQLKWSDGYESKLNVLWLRDHCQMPTSRDPISGQRLINITDIDPDIFIQEASLDDQANMLIIKFFPENHESHFSSKWLLENCYCRAHKKLPYKSRQIRLWHRETLQNNLPSYYYPNFCDEPEIKLSALESVKHYGFCILKDVPCNDRQVLKVIEQFGYTRVTNYGDIFEVRSKINANNLAYTNLGLGCHLDNPYRDPVPGLQLLHCLQSTTEGGDSILQDGFMAAKVLKDENPAHFEILSNEYINFRFQDKDADLQSRVPMIEVNDRNEVIKIRFNNRSIDTIKLAPDKIPLFYQAYRHFAELLEEKSLQINFKLQAGELMLFDNTRILHGRSAYSKGGTRHLQGAYSDLDGLYSTLNVLSRKLSNSKIANNE